MSVQGGEFEWRRAEDLSPYAYLDAEEVWVAYALGVPMMLAVRHTVDHFDADEEPTGWYTYAVLTAEDDGFSGFEPIGGGDTLEEAQAEVEKDRDEMIVIARQILADDE